ncbi:MAG TPA: HlyD family efflux transporter periplasmic adaptor subunit [Vicinamibacterales bacterium]|nr:HlyD family efflux transporter periplasmic adaptor subunit [Vicinamibacterales bacterium]
MRGPMWQVTGVLAGLMAVAGCRRGAEPDAYGNVEATSVVVGAEAAGRIVSFDVKEGDRLAASAVVGAIDAAELALQRDQLAAERGANASRVNEVARQIDVLQAQQLASAAERDAAKAQRAALEAQHEIARRAYDRTRRLFDQQAATAQQLDQAERDDRVLEQQIKAQDDQIAADEHRVAAQTGQIDATHALRQTATHQVVSIEAQVAQVSERIRKSQITNPIAGTVLVTYAKAGETVLPGQALYKIADLQSVEVRAYVTEPQLSRVRLGGGVQVAVDVGQGARRVFPGTVSWVSSQAEFTPTPVQTRDERADLVYAVKVRVANESGALKIGMPADVRFDAGGGLP